MSHLTDLAERMGRRAARMELLEWARLQPPVIHTERLLRFVQQAESADSRTPTDKKEASRP